MSCPHLTPLLAQRAAARLRLRLSLVRRPDLLRTNSGEYSHNVCCECRSRAELSEFWCCLSCLADAPDRAASDGELLNMDDVLSVLPLRCGRYERGHALQHFISDGEGHAVCVNTSSAGVWCYACDDAVEGADADLVRHAVLTVLLGDTVAAATSESTDTGESKADDVPPQTMRLLGTLSSEQARPPWICSKCTYSNPGMLLSCASCQAVTMPVEAAVAIRRGKRIDHILATTGAGGSTMSGKGGGEECAGQGAGVAFPEWPCQSCTFLNEPGMTNCRMCGGRRAANTAAEAAKDAYYSAVIESILVPTASTRAIACEKVVRWLVSDEPKMCDALWAVFNDAFQGSPSMLAELVLHVILNVYPEDAEDREGHFRMRPGQWMEVLYDNASDPDIIQKIDDCERDIASAETGGGAEGERREAEQLAKLKARLQKLIDVRDEHAWVQSVKQHIGKMSSCGFFCNGAELLWFHDAQAIQDALVGVADDDSVHTVLGNAMVAEGTDETNHVRVSISTIPRAVKTIRQAVNAAMFYDMCVAEPSTNFLVRVEWVAFRWVEQWNAWDRTTSHAYFVDVPAASTKAVGNGEGKGGNEGNEGTEGLPGLVSTAAEGAPISPLPPMTPREQAALDAARVRAASWPEVIDEDFQRDRGGGPKVDVEKLGSAYHKLCPGRRGFFVQSALEVRYAKTDVDR